MFHMNRTALPWTFLFALSGCVDALEVPDEGPAPGEVAVGVSQTVQLRFLRLDVKDYEQRLTQADLQDEETFPRKILEDVWVLDYDMRNPVEQVLKQLSELPADEADKLPVAAQNMRRLLNMTADNANLKGTKLENAIGLAGSVGIPPAKVLAALLQTTVSERVIPFDIAATVLLEDVLGTHPNAQHRLGPITAEHPDGKYPIAKHSLPLTMWDVVSNFEELGQRFGPVGEHPGFINRIEDISIGSGEMAIVIRANLNALPYKGVDLTSGFISSVNSTSSQIENIFDFEDPTWLRVEGLSDSVSLGSMSVTITENSKFLPGGDSKDPAPYGNSPIWDQNKWEFEYALIDMAKRRTKLVGAHCDPYELGTGVQAFEACIDDTGWTEMTTFTDIGDPPPPAYFWDILAEVAQVRLHDGGLAEGAANVEFTLKDVEIVLDQEKIIDEVKQNIRSNTKALAKLAERLNNNADGDADFYYYRPDTAAADDDYLYFITEDDLRVDAEGEPVRPYAYAHPGFYADADLEKKLSDTAPVDGDTTHEKLKVSPGQTVFVEDDAGHVFQIVVGEKPARSSLSLALTRVR